MSQLRANTIVNSAGDGSPSFPFGIEQVEYTAVAGVATYAASAGIATDATNAQGLTGTPDIAVRNITGAAATFTGNLGSGSGDGVNPGWVVAPGFGFCNDLTGGGSGKSIYFNYGNSGVMIGDSNNTLAQNIELDHDGNASFTGIITASQLVVTDGTFNGDVSIAGTITYQDVTDVNAVGIITANDGINVANGDVTVSAGIVTASGGFNIGISSANTTITQGPIKTLNFVGSGNTFAVNGTTVDISISGGSGGGGGGGGDGSFSQLDTWLFGGS